LLVRDEPIASIIQQALEGYASGLFRTQAEVKRFLEGQEDFPKTRHGTVTNETVNRLLNRVIYAGMVERPEWGVSLRPAQHEGLISFATFEKIQERLKSKAYAAARPDVSADFPLRGSVNCADCDKPMTSCWSKSKTGKKHPYYMCFSKGCVSNRKSIRRDVIEGEFDHLLRKLTPSAKMVNLFTAIFRKAWNMQAKEMDAMKAAAKRKINDNEKQTGQLLERIITASNASVITAYENQIGKLEREKLVLAEKVQNLGKPKHSFDEMFELALAFLANSRKV
jgi:hypothetical protein